LQELLTRLTSPLQTAIRSIGDPVSTLHQHFSALKSYLSKAFKYAVIVAIETYPIDFYHLIGMILWAGEVHSSCAWQATSERQEQEFTKLVQNRFYGDFLNKSE
jgi:hypothetical protein